MTNQRKYMIGELLSFLISDIRKRNNLYEYDVLEFIPKHTTDNYNAILFKPLLILLNLYSVLKKVELYYLPEIEIPQIIFNHRFIATTPDFVGGKIDLRATLLHQYKGLDGVVVKRRVKQPSHAHSVIIAKIFYEITAHSEIIVQYFHETQEQVDHLHYIVAEVNRISKKVNTKLMSVFGDIKNEVSSFIKNVHDKFYDAVHSHDLSMQHYSRHIIIDNDVVNSLTTIVDLSLRLRSQYLSCSIALMANKGISFITNMSTPSLYELWCFVRIITWLNNHEKAEVVQNMLVAPSAIGPLFDINTNHYVYYDNRNHAFTQKKGSAILNPYVLSSVYVEWLIINRNFYSQSFIVDAKYKNWNAGDVLKVLGYMTNFAINNAIIIFKNQIKDESIVGKRLSDRLYHCHIDKYDDANIYIMCLTPDSKYKDENESCISNMAEILLKKLPESTNDSPPLILEGCPMFAPLNYPSWFRKGLRCQA